MLKNAINNTNFIKNELKIWPASSKKTDFCWPEASWACYHKYDKIFSSQHFQRVFSTLYSSFLQAYSTHFRAKDSLKSFLALILPFLTRKIILFFFLKEKIEVFQKMLLDWGHGKWLIHDSRARWRTFCSGGQITGRILLLEENFFHFISVYLLFLEILTVILSTGMVQNWLKFTERRLQGNTLKKFQNFIIFLNCYFDFSGND